VAVSSPSPVVVGPGRHHAQREAARLDDHRALQPLLATVDRARAGGLAAAGCLGGAAVHRQLLPFQAEHAVIGGQDQQAQPLGDPGADPLVPAAAQGGGRAAVVGDAAVATPQDQQLDELVEDDAVSDGGPMAAQPMLDLVGGQQRGDLDPQGLQDRRWQGRHGTSR
jgi:hypothetical protein